MDLVQAIVLAIVQGLSEFLPISSSGHLILIPHFFDWQDQGLAFDVAVHVGTLIALLVYFRRQLGTMAGSWLDSVLRRQHTRDSRLAWQILVATIPVGLTGLFDDLSRPTCATRCSWQARSFFGCSCTADRLGR
jgi:undecaprenyl-diphosphatase